MGSAPATQTVSPGEAADSGLPAPPEPAAVDLTPSGPRDAMASANGTATPPVTSTPALPSPDITGSAGAAVTSEPVAMPGSTDEAVALNHDVPMPLARPLTTMPKPSQNVGTSGKLSSLRARHIARADVTSTPPKVAATAAKDEPQGFMSRFMRFRLATAAPEDPAKDSRRAGSKRTARAEPAQTQVTNFGRTHTSVR
jgi:hypothetical protein